MTAHDDLAEDDAIIAAATAEPWIAEEVEMAQPPEGPDWPVWWIETEDGSIAEFRAGCLEVEGKQEANAIFCVRARARYPALVAEVRELRQKFFVVQAALARLWACNHGDETICGCRRPADDYFNSLPGPARHEEGA